MTRPWDKSEYTEYYDLMKQAESLRKQLLQYRDIPRTRSHNPL